jgi:predicted oxidoreductase (fatty acid repression mutant protein)
MAKDFLAAVAERRTYYGISKEAVIQDEEIIKIINHTVMHTPSAFNSQSARIILLLGDNHDKLWEMTKNVLRNIVPADRFSETENKINSFKNGYGTILFFEDSSVIEALQQQYAAYKDNFPIWSQQASGMHQFVVWTALETEGFGVSLQHYNELIENHVKKEWNVPETWKLIAQMPFGKPVAPPAEKMFLPLDERIKIFK